MVPNIFRTSSGKSSIINSIIGNNIMPNGIGHTTSSMVCVQAGDVDTSKLYESRSASDAAAQVTKVSSCLFVKICFGACPFNSILYLKHACCTL